MPHAPVPISGRKIRFALAGCGRIAEKHFDALEQHAERAELVAVCDTDPAALKRAVTRTKARGFASLGELLAGSNADVIVLATPSGIHAAQTIQAAEAGRHVMTEKPMATRWYDGKAMVAACDKAGVELFVVKQNRQNATIQLLRRAIEQRRFGRIYMVSVNVFWSRPQAYYDSAAWRGTWEYDGGAFMNQASHYVDLLDWLIGPVESVHAFTATLARRIEVEDTGVASRAVAERGAGVGECYDAGGPEEFRGFADGHRREGHRPRGRRRGERDPALAVCRAGAGGREDPGGQLRHHLGLWARAPALLRQRDQGAPGRGECGDRWPGGAPVAGIADRDLCRRGTGRRSGCRWSCRRCAALRSFGAADYGGELGRSRYGG